MPIKSVESDETDDPTFQQKVWELRSSLAGHRQTYPREKKAGLPETEEREINVGDVVHIKAGERHWHGAKADTTMGHITVTAVGGEAIWG